VVAGLTTATAVNPVDLVKTRWMGSVGKGLYSSPWDCFLQTVRREGIRGDMD
jgi:hypothetical protein